MVISNFPLNVTGLVWSERTREPVVVLLWIWQGDCYKLCLRLKCHAMRPGRLRSDCGAQDREKAVEGLRVPFTGKFPF